MGGPEAACPTSEASNCAFLNALRHAARPHRFCQGSIGAAREMLRCGREAAPEVEMQVWDVEMRA